MINFLIRRVIKNAEMTQDLSVRKQYGLLSGTVGIVLNLLLATLKLVAGTITASIAITADGFNNLSDAASSMATLIGFKMAGAPNDKTHPFGHGRIEYLAGFFVSLFIILTGVELIKSAAGRILHPADTLLSAVAVAALLISIGVKLWMFFFNRRLAGAIRSTALEASARDSLSDCVATLAVLLGSLAGLFFHLHLDGILGLAVGLFILYGGLSSARDTINPLLGEAPDPEFVKEITSTVLAHPEIVGMHDLIVHNYGPGRIMLTLHAEVPCDGDILEMHDVIDLTERELRQKFDCDAVIHMDPIATHDARVAAVREQITELVKSIDSRLTIHDFRMVSGPSHTNLIFDVVVPHPFPLTDRQVTARIQEEVQKLDRTYFAVVEVDQSFV